MAPQVIIETPENVKESISIHLLRHEKNLNKKGLTQYNCSIVEREDTTTTTTSDNRIQIKCYPFTRYFWECVHLKSDKTLERYHWEI